MIWDKVYNFRSRFSYIADLAPVFVFVGITICLLNIAIFNIKPYDENLYLEIDWFLRHVFDYSLFFIMFMFFKSQNWRLFSWACYLCLVSLWLLNLVYVCLGLDTDFYFMVFVLAIYCIFVIFTVAKLTNRC